MIRSKLILAVSIVVICLASCSPKYYFQDVVSNDNTPMHQFNASDKLYIETRFAGDAIDYIVFEIDIQNDSEYDVPIHIDDISLEVIDNETYQELYLQAIGSDELISALSQQKSSFKQNRKAENAASIIGIGIGVIALSTGNSAAGILDNSLILTDLALGALDNNRAGILLEGDIENQMAYAEEWVLTNEIISPHNSITFDLIFPRTLLDGSGQLIIKNENIDYTCGYLFRKQRLSNYE